MNFALNLAMMTCTAPSMFLVIRYLRDLQGQSFCSSALLALRLVSFFCFQLRPYSKL
jgi:hypothetical protein